MRRFRRYVRGHEPGGVGWCYTDYEDARRFVSARRLTEISIWYRNDMRGSDVAPIAARGPLSWVVAIEEDL